MANNHPLSERNGSINSHSSEYRPARLQRRSYYIALALAVVGLGISLANIFRAPQQKQKFSLKELSYSQVINLFDLGAPEIIVSHPYGTDTLWRESDYILLRDKINAIASSPKGVVAVSDEGSDEWKESNNTGEKLPVLRLDVSGPRKAGSMLEFTIEDYDPKVFYFLDFGDGFRRKVDRKSVFTYTKPGTFNVQLYASIADKNLYDSYSKVIQIETTSGYIPPKRTPKNSLSDLFPQQQDEKLINKPNALNDDNLVLTDPDFDEIDSLFNEDSDLQISDLGVLDEKDEIGPIIEDETDRPFGEDEEPEEVIETSLDETPAYNKAYYDAEMMPEFPGGVKAMARYLRKNANYPERASRAGIEGTVNVRLVVRADGSLSDLKVLNGLGYGCDDEALRVVSKMPRWIPGVQNGVSVPVYTVIPITFRLIE